MTEELNREQAPEEASETEIPVTETPATEAEETEIKPKDAKKQLKAVRSELEKTKKENEELSARLAEANDKYLRLAAEYENFRKRSQREREAVYGDATFDSIKKLLPTIDNLERAAQSRADTTAFLRISVLQLFIIMKQSLKRQALRSSA